MSPARSTSCGRKWGSCPAASPPTGTCTSCAKPHRRRLVLPVWARQRGPRRPEVTEQRMPARTRLKLRYGHQEAVRTASWTWSLPLLRRCHCGMPRRLWG